MRVKDKLRSRDMEIGEELIQDTLPNENVPTDDDIDIKYEEIGFPFHNSTSEHKSNQDPDTDTMPNIKLNEHIRATHGPLQLIQDSTHIDPPEAHYSLSIQIKSEVDENIVKIECSERQSELKLVADLDFELRSGRESDPHCSATGLTQNVRPRSHSFKKHGSRGSKTSKINKRILPPRPHFKCSECSKSFNYLYLLKAHKRSHTRDKPFKCDECEKTFTRSDNLSTHKRIHTGEKPFKCDVCGKSFRTNTHLKTHKRRHTGEKPFKCGVCEKNFIASGDLTRHMRSHTRDKTFKCDVCDRSFSRSNNLARHMKMHNGENPFMCEVCMKSFSRQDYLKRHKKRHT